MCCWKGKSDMVTGTSDNIFDHAYIYWVGGQSASITTGKT